MGYLMPKNSSGTILPIALQGDKRVYTFHKGISPKVNVIAPQGFELIYNNVTVLHVSHYATGLPCVGPYFMSCDPYFC